MTVAESVAEILRHHVTLEVEGIDRMYLNAVVPLLQSEGGSPGTSERSEGTGSPHRR